MFLDVSIGHPCDLAAHVERKRKLVAGYTEVWRLKKLFSLSTFENKVDFNA